MLGGASVSPGKELERDGLPVQVYRLLGRITIRGRVVCLLQCGTGDLF